jgi:hypothetical protein
MAADDEAVRRSGRSALVAALLAIATGAPVSSGGVLTADGSGMGGGQDMPVPAVVLAAAAHAVPARVERLLRPPRAVTTAIGATTLAALSAVLAVAPATLALLAR